MKVTAKASIGIQKPIEEIFEGIVNPEIMVNYFISKGSGRMESGKEIYWEFPEFDGSYPVSVREIRKDEYISFVWDPDSFVEIKLESLTNGDTVVRVFEEGHQPDDEGIKWAIGQSEGWANFLACMKAWLEYGIHLRKGAFDFMKS
ncbi:SRPBCC domain-containing protein [Sphingobacterium chuzhouense]|uniref:SRPBCC domain-containing protein n=1 Tax=Sphingobacterium chuzhouense TaxID=1742264 RepID=A0ABR7XTV8_9SPHI|nr:SRPBCC domain-containing protein [Sphingobacterium chuzhouense]MBD1421742.1 SRPBCC domain-containing protein [Sphingobacterium chuzhouense]